jgi:hypothetical protein
MARSASRPARDALLSCAAACVAYVACPACSPQILIGADTTTTTSTTSTTSPLPDASGEIEASSDVVVDAGVDLDAYLDADADALGAIDFPWSTSFENGDADYQMPQGYCYDQNGGTHKIVSAPAPVHTGTHSMAFSVFTDAGPVASQSRCVRQGVLPPEAYYGAWYYLPAPVTNFGLWNLIHFQGGDSPTSTQHGLWDVSLTNDGDGGLKVWSFDFLRTRNLEAGAVPAIPIGVWFQLEVYWRRAADNSGQFTLYQDKKVALDVTGVPTDDTHWGQYYVGDFANFLLPANVTVYVDDITIGPTLQ